MNPKQTFGQLIRKTREMKEISLRKFAEMVGVSATYISKVERDEVEPPAEDRVRKMAQILDMDSDWLLGLADKVSSDLKGIIQDRPQLMAAFLRTAAPKSDETLKRAIEFMQHESVTRKEPPN